MATEPFKVTAKLLDGRVNSIDGLFFLDAILYHAWFLKYEPGILTSEKKGKPKHFGLPLLHLPNNRYAASIGFYEQYSQKVEYWNKRPRWDKHPDYLNLEKGKIKTSVGLERAYRMPNIIRTISDVEFYGVGTIEKIKDLLSYMPAIGKKPSAGWGAVKEWVVEPFEHDWSTQSNRYGLMRPLPVAEAEQMGINLDDYMMGEFGIRPPYWKHKNKEVCIIPRSLKEH